MLTDSVVDYFIFDRFGFFLTGATGSSSCIHCHAGTYSSALGIFLPYCIFALKQIAKLSLLFGA